ncbi:MAG: TonB-dependent receptor domain-containing protein [Bryobacteraceae bacterium]
MKKLLAIGVAAILAAVVFGQSFTGTILGTVRDSTGAVVPRASIVLINTGTNTRTAVTTDDNGNYTGLLLPPGHYSIEVTAQGFKKFVQGGIVLQVQQQARVDIPLSVGDVAESVTVTADASVLETTTTSVGKVVDNRRIVNLPLNTRNVYSLVFLTPGVAGTVGNNYGEMRYSVNGARARMLDTLIDGVTAAHATVTGFSGISVFPSVDAIEEFKVMGATYSAEFGRSMGSVLNVAYKSGTNQFHGSAYEFLRNSVLDSNNFFDNRRGIALRSFKRSQFGYFLGGPIRRDKTFFMTAFEALRDRTFANRTFTVPTEIERAGNFSQTRAQNGTMITMFNPFSTRPNPSGSGFIRDPFPSNQIPANMFDPVALNVIKFYPQSNIAGAAVTNANNYSQSGSQSNPITQHDYRIDHMISPAQRFFARYSTRLNESVPVISFPSQIAIAEGRIVEEDHVHGAVADYTNTLSPTTILNARLGFARTLYKYNNQGLGFVPSTLGLPTSIDTAVDRQIFPSFGTGNFVGLGGRDHRSNVFMSYTALANVTRIIGKHNIKTGFEGRLLRVNVWEASSNGVFSFNAGMTQGPNPNQASSTAGNGLASMLVGAGSSGQIIQSFKNVAVQSFYIAGYIQDDYRVTAKLTLNLGLRWDIDTPRTERFDRMNYFDPFVASPLANVYPGLKGGLVFVGRDGQPRTDSPADKNNLAPRIGLAYQFTPKTVFRASYAHLWGASHQAAHGTFGTQGFRRDHPWVTSLDGITPLNLLRNPYPNGFPPIRGAGDGLLTATGTNVASFTQNTIAPWTRQMSASIQRELPGQILLETAYVGTRGFQLYRNGEGGLSLNQLLPEHLALGARLNDLVANPFFGRITSGALASAQVRRGQLLRPFPQFENVTPLFSSGASSFYHALQVTTSKRFAKGLQFEGSYTWSKNIDDGESHQNSYDIRATRALASIDLAHRFVMGYVYQLPFGRGHKFGGGWARWLDLAAGQWQVNGITTFQTGTPIAISASNSIGLFNPTSRANNNGRSAKLTGPVHERLNRYYDISVFSQPAAFTFGNAPARLPDVRVDGVRNWDISLFKDFILIAREPEPLRLQFRAEFLNGFNTPRFGGPNTSVTSTSQGVITSQANAPRQIQLGLKVLW